MVKKLDLTAITKRVQGEQEPTRDSTPDYKDAPDYLERRMDRQNELTRGKRERRTLYRVDPKTCRIWAHHDRDYARLNETTCADLIEGFRANGQIIPATVRVIDDETYQYEICAGARRHWTAKYLGIDLLIEIRELDDEGMFLLSDEENRNRQDISDYERALKYQYALKAHYKNQKQMALRMGVSEDWLSRHLQLTKLPIEIIHAYDTFDSIKTRHVRDIKPLLLDKAIAIKVIEAAKAMHTNPQPGPDVIKRLKAAANSKKPAPIKKQGSAITLGEKNKTPFATLTKQASKSITIEIKTTQGATLNDWQTAIKMAWEMVADDKKSDMSD